MTWLVSPAGILIIGFPPLVYLMIFTGFFLYRRKTSDLQSFQSRKAGSRLAKSLKAAKHIGTPQQTKTLILEALKTYLGDILRMPAGALTFSDVRGPLSDKGVDTETINDLKALFSECEAARYGSSVTDQSSDHIISQTIRVAKKLENICK
jgi:hypothetical protein